MKLSPEREGRKAGCVSPGGVGMGAFLPENSPRVTTGKVFKIK